MADQEPNPEAVRIMTTITATTLENTAAMMRAEFATWAANNPRQATGEVTFGYAMAVGFVANLGRVVKESKE